MHNLKQLADEAGHALDPTQIAKPEWLAASISSHAGDYEPMASVIAGALKQAVGGR